LQADIQSDFVIEHVTDDAKSRLLIYHSRSKRSDMPLDRGAILDALGACRTAMILGVQSRVRINGPVFVAANAVVTAIDALDSSGAAYGRPSVFLDRLRRRN
jgi:hypothetical protein